MNGGIKKPTEQPKNQVSCLGLGFLLAVFMVCATAILITWIIYGGC